MSLEQSLDKIIDEESSSKNKHRVTRYRRRDLRNSLADRIGKGRSISDRQSQNSVTVVSKRRVKISKIPLDVSDFVIEDILKEFGNPSYFNIYDTKDDRVAICEFPENATMDKVIEKFNGMDINGVNLEAESTEFHSRQNKHNRTAGRNYNDIKPRGKQRNQYESSGKTPNKREKRKPATAEDLDAELEAYMNS